jgi:hypothetical protein
VALRRIVKPMESGYEQTEMGRVLNSNTWYSSMKPINTPNKMDGKSKANSNANVRVYNEVLGAKIDKRPITWRSEVTRIHPSTITVPPYTSYVGLDTSVLVESTNKLLIHPPPFFPEAKEHQLGVDLPGIYRTNFERRSDKLLHDHMAERYRPDIEAFLRRLGISELDILGWLFKKRLVPDIEQDRLELLLTEAEAWPLKQEPNSEYTYNTPSPSDLESFVVSKLTPSTTRVRAYAVLACVVIDRHMDPKTEFDSWEFFRRGPVLKDLLEETANTSDSESDSSQVKQPNSSTQKHRLICRVCNL